MAGGIRLGHLARDSGWMVVDSDVPGDHRDRRRLCRERERHTLETLLASRLSDRAILFGKNGAAIGYSFAGDDGEPSRRLAHPSTSRIAGRTPALRSEHRPGDGGVGASRGGIRRGSGRADLPASGLSQVAQQALAGTIMVLLPGGCRYHCAVYPHDVETPSCCRMLSVSPAWVSSRWSFFAGGLTPGAVALALLRFRRSRLIADDGGELPSVRSPEGEHAARVLPGGVSSRRQVSRISRSDAPAPGRSRRPSAASCC